MSVVRSNLYRRISGRVSGEAASLLDALVPLWNSGLPSHPSVYFGRRNSLNLGDAIRGGLVKVQHLQRVFPNSTRSANILYLVSSAQPARASLLGWAAGIRGIRLVWNQNGVAYPGWHGPGWQEVNGRMAAFLRRARHVFYQSEFCRKASDLFLEPRADGAEVLPNPVDTIHFRPSRPPTPPEVLVLLAGGTCYQRYRFETAVQTLRCLLDARIEARLRFAGKPAWGARASDDASDIVARMGLSARVEFVPPYSQEAAPEVIGAAHVLLHTKYNDNCPTLVLEAMACGLPVAYSASGGTPELVGPEAGIGIPAPLDWDLQHPPDPEALADAVRRMLGDYPRRSEAARRRAVEHFDVAPWLERHRQVFQRLLEGR